MGTAMDPPDPLRPPALPRGTLDDHPGGRRVWQAERMEGGMLHVLVGPSAGELADKLDAAERGDDPTSAA